MAILTIGDGSDIASHGQAPKAALWGREALLMTASRKSFSTGFTATKAALVAEGCGPEPERNPPNALGVRTFKDTTAGQKWNACISAIETAKQKAYYDRVVGKQAGPPNGCGPEPSFKTRGDGTKLYDGTQFDLRYQEVPGQYVGNELGRAWARCMGYDAAAKTNAAPVQPVPDYQQPERGAAAVRTTEPTTSSSASTSAVPYQGPQATAAEAKAVIEPSYTYTPAGGYMPGKEPTSPAADPASTPRADAPAPPPPFPDLAKSATGVGSGTIIAVGAAALAVGVGLYFALR